SDQHRIRALETNLFAPLARFAVQPLHDAVNPSPAPAPRHQRTTRSTMQSASTTPSTTHAPDPAARTFEAHRDRLWRIAYGILASPEDADDLVQEAYLRWHRTDHATVRRPEAWRGTAQGGSAPGTGA